MRKHLDSGISQTDDIDNRMQIRIDKRIADGDIIIARLAATGISTPTLERPLIIQANTRG